MKALKATIAIGTIVLSTGCASILTEKTAKVNVQTSTGEQAVVSIDNKDYTVPAIVEVMKDGEDKVIKAKDDQCAQETLLRKEITPEFWVNILTGGTFGSTTDMQTKKMWTYQDSITVSCK